MTAPDAGCVVVTGAYGVGKSTLVEEIAYRMERGRRPFAAIDLDWLAWFTAADAAEENAVRLANLRDVVRRYVAHGVRYVAVAHAVADAAAVRDIEAAVGLPVTVVGLRLPLSEIRHRLAAGVTRARREDDLAVAEEWSATGRGTGFEDLVLDGDRPVEDLADEVMTRLGWLR